MPQLISWDLVKLLLSSCGLFKDMQIDIYCSLSSTPPLLFDTAEEFVDLHGGVPSEEIPLNCIIKIHSLCLTNGAVIEEFITSRFLTGSELRDASGCTWTMVA